MKYILKVFFSQPLPTTPLPLLPSPPPHGLSLPIPYALCTMHMHFVLCTKTPAMIKYELHNFLKITGN